jgi:hypothetical protein
VSYIPKNTLAYFQAAPHFSVKALGDTPVTQFAKATKAYRVKMDQLPRARPCPEAVNFYGLNHMAAIVKERFTPNEPLPEWALLVMNAYLAELVHQTERLTHYNISICTREMRHIQAPSQALQKGLNNIHPLLGDYICGLKSSGEDGALNSYYSSPLANCTVTQYMAGQALAFSKVGGGKFSGGYGGDPWSNIAKCLWSVMAGKTSLEMFVDTSYTLAHNNGAMFNKPLLYQFGGADNGNLIQILDVQRSGQIPEMIMDPKHWAGLDIADLVCTPVIKKVKEEVPGAFGEYVDWLKVDKDKVLVGGGQNYGPQILHQSKSNPVATVVKFNGKPATVIGSYTVWPGQSLPIIKRAA